MRVYFVCIYIYTINLLPNMEYYNIVLLNASIVINNIYIILFWYPNQSMFYQLRVHHTHTYLYTHIYTYLHTHIRTYTHTYTRIFTRTYTYIHTHTHTYTHIHTCAHIHTCMLAGRCVYDVHLVVQFTVCHTMYIVYCSS